MRAIVRRPSVLLWIVASCATAPLARAGDARTLYDVQAYRIDLRVDPATSSISGSVTVEVIVLAPSLDALELDMAALLEAESVHLVVAPISGAPSREGKSLEFRHTDARLVCVLPKAARQGDRIAVLVRYSGHPDSIDSFDGFHWKKTKSGAPWISTSSQGVGAEYWWPCKDSFFHPEDKPEHLFVNLTVPKGLLAVSNGRLDAREAVGDGWETFRWRHDYPLETYAVTLNVAPYVEVASELHLEGIAEPVPFVYYVLPESEEKARVQFAEVPELLAIYGRAFGPYPFPKSKFALVETSFWGMEHSTAVAYGSSFPSWIREHGGKDPYASRNRYFDYILVHEVAHEWWGNGVSAADWGDFWLHEGFATYAEGVYVEYTKGRADADRFFADLRRSVEPRGSLYRGRGTDSNEAYSPILYGKGGLVLNTLRHYVDDDERWWQALRQFNLRYRYANATTEDFRVELEAVTGRSWIEFFEEWIYGKGYPVLKGDVRTDGRKIEIEIENRGSDETTFHVPLDLAWRESDEPRSKRVWLAPGANKLEIECEHPPRELAVVDLQRVLGKYDVNVEK